MRTSLSSALFLSLLLSCSFLVSADRELKVEDQTITSLLEMVHLNPVELQSDPYDDYVPGKEDSLEENDAVCGIVFDEEDPATYRTITFANALDAEENGAHITHFGACGVCSSLQDLAIYRSNPDLTTPARRCGFLSLIEPFALYCFEKIGFSKPCAKIWFYNARNTGSKCLLTCLISFLSFEKNNLDNGSLNDCLQCDEDNSGFIFKKYGGRTRRNSGLSSEIGRPPEEIYDVDHDYDGKLRQSIPAER